MWTDLNCGGKDEPASDLLECLTGIHTLEPSSHTMREDSSLFGLHCRQYDLIQLPLTLSPFLLQFMGMPMKEALCRWSRNFLLIICFSHCSVTLTSGSNLGSKR